MPPKVSGIKNQPITQPDEDGVIDRFGVSTLTLVEMVSSDQFTRLLRAVGTPHPNFPNMGVSRAAFSKSITTAGTFYRVSYVYEGFIASLPEPTYELSASLSEDPIETNSKFETFAGKPSAPLNGAVFVDQDGKPTSDDEVGVFLEFKARIDGEPNRKAGVDSYAAPGALWTEVKFSATRPSEYRKLGTIDSPSGPNPTIPDGGNWLLWDHTYRQRGGIFEIRTVWKASGPNGWDEDIYGA